MENSMNFDLVIGTSQNPRQSETSNLGLKVRVEKVIDDNVNLIISHQINCLVKQPSTVVGTDIQPEAEPGEDHHN